MITELLGKLLAEKNYAITKIKEEPVRRFYWIKVLKEITRRLDQIAEISTKTDFAPHLN